jgi:DNA-binding transcriptional MerR regulator
LKRNVLVSNTPDEYSINELARKADVSVRTIRFYINEGLLPAAQMRGRYAVYTEEYLDRLELIRRLKDSFLPLKEIRATLMSLSWEEVRATLADLRQQDAGMRPSQEGRQQPAGRQVRESRSSALDYIADLLTSTPANRPLPPRAAPHQPAPPAQPPGMGQESWQRVILAPGVELHLRQPLPQEDQPKIEALIRLGNKLFSA